MTYISKPNVHHPKLSRNGLGLTRRDYEGAISTLCAGCGHDSVSAALIQACFELNLPAHRIAKLSGIGCSSKTPTYFLGNSHGFNSVHGRMPSVATGANLANRSLYYIGVSGDGDSASIGLGQFAHVVRRNLNMVYIVDNNGTYGLTKGQFSATNDYKAKSKKGLENLYQPVDLVTLAIQLGAGFVARSFSGDKKQLVPLLKAAIQYRGFAFIDVISPCVAFNNHNGSMKSYQYIREHDSPVVVADFVSEHDDMVVDYQPGSVEDVVMPDGSRLRLRKLTSDYDPHDRISAMSYIQQHQRDHEVVTGLLYMDREELDLHSIMDTTETPLNTFSEKQLCPGSEVLDDINQSLR